MQWNQEQQIAYNLAAAGKNLMITGQGGTGKSALIHGLIELFESQHKTYAVTSTTGISAQLIGGVTIHRFAGIQRGELDFIGLLDRVRKNKRALKNWRQTDVLIIDEISMLTPELFDKLEGIAMRLRRGDKAFGGMQVILTGDFCQLPPVETDVLCFGAMSWNRVVQHTIYLTRNMRQSEATFQRILSQIRLGIVTYESRQVLESRVNVDVANVGVKPTKLFSHRAAVEEMNVREMNKLLTADNKKQRFKARDQIKSVRPIPESWHSQYVAMMDKSCPAPKVLDLCVGAQVMLTYNLDVEAGFCNGSRGVITRFTDTQPKMPEVRFSNGAEMLIQHQVWDLKLGHGAKITRTQLPLILAFASTIHKIQGSSITCAEMDLGETIFAPGQFYTALSRVRTLEGLCITDLNFDGVRIHPQAEEYYAELEKLSLASLKKTLFLCLRRKGVPRGPAMIACSYVVPLYT